MIHEHCTAELQARLKQWSLQHVYTSCLNLCELQQQYQTQWKDVNSNLEMKPVETTYLLSLLMSAR